jgi:sugar phosphate isomerase/epimerase
MIFGNEVNPMNDIVEDIKLIKKLGCDYAEITIEDPYNLPEILELRKKEIKNVLKLFKYPPLAHFSWRVDIGTDDEIVRRAWIEEVKKSMLIAKKLGCIKFTVHYTNRFNVNQNEPTGKIELDKNILSLKELMKFSKKIEIQLMLEPAAKEGKLHLKNFAYVADNVQGLKINLDISHVFLNGGMKTVEDFINYFGKRIIHFHFSDNTGNDDEHLAIGSGKINYERIVELIKKINYNDTITFEIFELPRTNVIKSIAKIKKLFSS